MKYIFLVCIIAGSWNSGNSLSPEVQQLADDYWNWRLRDYPEYATFVGMNEYNDLLDDISQEAYQYRYDNATTFFGRAEGLESDLILEEDIINIRVFKDELQTFIDGFPFKMYLNPINNREGMQIDFTRLLGWMPKVSLSNYDTLLNRMKALPTQIDQAIALLREGVSSGIAMHENSMNKVVTQLGTFLTADPVDSPIYQQFFTTFPDNFTAEQVLDFQTQAASVIADMVNPAYQTLSDYISNEYITRADIAVTSLPNGVALYTQFIKFCTGSNYTPEVIQQMGFDEVDRIEQLMLEIVQELGFNMTVQEFSAMISSDPDNYYATEEELLDGFRYIVYNVTTPAVPQIFSNIPQADIIVQGDPTGTGAFYLTGTYDGSRPGVFYVGTQDVSAQAKFGMLTLSLHEGNPGHHLQGSHAIENPNMPYFRSFMEDRNYGHAPSRFPIRSYYMEGWGLYAESTGFDMNLFGDLYERYGHYSDEIFRACRLVVDTGIHALGWTREEAIQYVLDHTAMTRLDVENEIDRYITWPAQALSYKIGQLQISEMRADAETQLGPELFDLKEFHEVVLQSLGPMEVVREEVDKWIQNRLNTKKHDSVHSRH